MAKTIVIDCAFDEFLASKLFEYLKDKRYNDVSIEEESKVVVRGSKELSKTCEKDLVDFAAESEEGYEVTNTYNDGFLVAKKANVEDFGLSTCELCGYVAFEEELFAHRRTHGI